jgi:hypothetical protein
MDRYSEIKVDLNENLNINAAILEIVKKCWYDKKRFTTVNDIAKVTQTSTRNIYKIVKDNKLGERKSLMYNCKK